MTRIRRPRRSLFHYQSLEPRQLLANTFDFDGRIATLMVDEVNSIVTISQNETDYLFALENGTWTGTDNADVTGDGASQLAIDKTALNEASDGLFFSAANGREQNLSTIFSNVDFTGMEAPLQIVGQHEITQGSDSSVKLQQGIFGAENIALDLDSNELTKISISEPARRISLYSANSLEFGSPLASIDANRISIRAGGDVTISSQTLIAENIDLESPSSIAINVAPSETGEQSRFDVFRLDLKGADISIQAHTDFELNGRQIHSKLERLLFESTAAVNIRLSESHLAGPSPHITRLADSSTANTLQLIVSGRLGTAPNTHLTIHGNAWLESKFGMLMGFHNNVAINIGGKATLTTHSQPNLPAKLIFAENAEINFGSLQINDGASRIAIWEDSTMNIAKLVSYDAKVDLQSSQHILNEPNAVIRCLTIFIKTDGVIKLGEFENNYASVTNARLEADRMFIGGAGTFSSVHLNFNAKRNVAIAHQRTITLFGENHAGGDVRLSTPLSIRNSPGANISARAFNAYARNHIRLVNRANESLDVGLASFRSGISTIIGESGSANFVSLALETGYAFIREQSNTHFRGQVDVTDLVVQSTGYISDNAEIRFEVRNNAHLVTPLGILLGDKSGDSLRFCDHVTFEAGNFVRVEELGMVTIASQTVVGDPFSDIHIDFTSC